MRLLLRLYPRAWRDRYGLELEQLVADQPISFALVVDLLAGAIDARLHPQMARYAAASPPREGDAPMLARILGLRCAGYGPHVTARDQWTALAVTLGGTMVLTLVWMSLKVRMANDAYLDAFSAMPFLAPFVASMHFTSLKGRPASTQAVFIGGTLLALTLIALAAGFVGARI
jgi:hypothetical protein